MTTLDTKLVPKALELCNKYGKSAVFYESGFRQYDPNTGEVTEGAPTERTVNVTPPSMFDRRMVDGDTVQADDLKVYIPASGLPWTPVTGMKCKFDDSTYAVLNIERVYTGDSIALYGVQLRR